MTSPERDTLSQPLEPKHSSSVEEEQEKEDIVVKEEAEKVQYKENMEITHETTDSIEMTEDEELTQSEMKDDGEKVSLFPCCLRQIKSGDNRSRLYEHIKHYHHDKDATKCVFCGRELSSKSSLDRHLLTHAKYQPYPCKYCDKQFSTNGNMHRHMKTHKGACKGSKGVKEALKVRRKRKLNAEDLLESEQPVKEFKSSHTENIETSCDNNKINVSKSNDKTCHESLTVLSSPTKEEFISTLGLRTACRPEDKLVSSNQINLSGYIRSLKDELSSRVTSLQYHFISIANRETFDEDIGDLSNKVDGHWLPESPETSTESNLFDPMPNEMNISHYCEHCNAYFRSRLDLSEHLETHAKDKPFKCKLCDKELQTKPNALRHVIKLHKKRKTQAEQLIEVLDHPSLAATKNICEWCGEKFKSSIGYGCHKRSHEGCQGKPYLCLICNKSFSTKNNGKRHRSSHHKDEQSCIVPNTKAKNNINMNSLPKVRDNTPSPCAPSTSTASTSFCELEDKLDESISSSESEHEFSRPKKDLDAAQSLIDMMSSLPPLTSHEEEKIKAKQVQPDIHHSSPVQDNSSYYLPMTTPVNEQNKPLDLSVHPMDLSFKTNKPDDECNLHKFKQLAISPIPYSFKDRYYNRNAYHFGGIFNAIKTEYENDTPLNLVSKKEHNFNRDLDSFSSSSIESNDGFTSDKEHTTEKECNSLKSSERRNECNLCSMSFSTNSNKRRHEKTKHLMHCKEPHSPKNSLDFSTKDKQLTTTKSILSKKTKEALITKVSNLKSDLISNEMENGDLASVSSLINTANSPELKKYLEEVPTEVKDQGKPDAVQEKPNVDQKGSGKHWCSVCQKQFTCKSSFNRHSVIHTKKREHSCQECKKTFTTKSNRDRHLKKVHRIMLSRDSKKPLSTKKQKKSAVPNETSEMEIEVKDLALPKELAKSDISQCNKENQRLFMSV